MLSFQTPATVFFAYNPLRGANIILADSRFPHFAGNHIIQPGRTARDESTACAGDVTIVPCGPNQYAVYIGDYQTEHYSIAYPNNNPRQPFASY